LAEAADAHRRVVAATGYAFTPVVPMVVLASEMKHDPFLRRHAAQALVWAGPFLLSFVPAALLLIALLRMSLVAICALPVVIVLPFVPGTIWGFKIYDGQDVRIRWITPLAERLVPPSS
jgi:uncharacterized membrane protein